MATVLCIAGHGKLRSGGNDPGATGLISKGEHRYMKENLFPAMKKFVPKDADFVFFSDYKVLDYGNLVALANKYGKDTIVVEYHYDAASAAARGGHVIVHSDFEPDAIDLRLRDAISDNVGVRYNHKGHKGISGRNNLGNVNRAKNGGINYRLIELGFGTNKEDVDVMINKTEQYAKSLVEALLNKDVSGTPKETSKPVSKPVAKPSTGSSGFVNGSAGQRVVSIYGGSEGLNFYSNPEFKNPVGTFGKGLGWDIIERVKVGSSYMFKVKNSKGAVYYVTASAKYVKVEGTAKKSTNSKSSSGIKSVGKIKMTGVNNFTYIYEKTNDKSKRLGQAKKNQVFDISGSVSGWWEVIHNGKRGYIKSKYASRV